MRNQELVKLSTTDNVTLTGFYTPGKDKKAIILLHQFTSSKEAWKTFIDSIPEKYHVLALDLRGHGQSALNWEDFHEQEFSAMIHDTEAAYTFFKSKGISDIVIIGASIGANLALKFSMEHPITSTVLLSPGIKYRGLSIEKDLEHIKIPTLVIAGSQDSYSHDTLALMKEQLKNKNHFLTYDTKNHGTTLLRDKEVIKEITQWLNKY